MGLLPNQTPAFSRGLSGAPPGLPATIATTTISLQPTGPCHMASGMDTLGIRRGPDQPQPRRSNLPDRPTDLRDGHDRYPTCSRPQEGLTPAVIPFQTTVPGHLDKGGAASGLRHEPPVLPGSQIGIRHGSGQFDSSIRSDVAPSPTSTLKPLPPTANISPSAIPGSLVSGRDAIGIQRKLSTSTLPPGDNPFVIGIQPEGTPVDPLPPSAGSSAPPLPPATLPAFQASSAAQTGLSPHLELPPKPSPQSSAGGTPLPAAATPPVGLGSRLPAKPSSPPVADTSSPPPFAASQPSSDAQTGLGFPPERFPPSLPPNPPQHPAGSVSVLDTIRPRRLLPSNPLGAAAAGTPAPPLFAASQSSSDAQTGLGSPARTLLPVSPAESSPAPCWVRQCFRHYPSPPPVALRSAWCRRRWHPRPPALRRLPVDNPQNKTDASADTIAKNNALSAVHHAKHGEYSKGKGQLSPLSFADPKDKRAQRQLADLYTPQTADIPAHLLKPEPGTRRWKLDRKLARKTLDKLPELRASGCLHSRSSRPKESAAPTTQSSTSTRT